MKPRLFWTMLFAFSLVILLGICGMLGFFGMSFSGYWREEGAAGRQAGRQALADTVADYYTAHEESWQGIEQRVAAIDALGMLSWQSYALLDADGRVLISNDPALQPGQLAGAALGAQGLPVLARGKRAGTLLLPPEGQPPWASVTGHSDGPPALMRPFARGFLLAGLALAAVLLGLAVWFAQRLSRPIRRLTVAARALSAGNLDQQLEGAPVRELHELTLSFNHMAQALKQADRQRRQMTADIAHELRTPLTIIKGRLEGLQDGVYSATPEQIAQLIAEAELLERLVEDLRLLALAEAGQLPLYRELSDPRELLEGALASFAGQAQAQGVVLSLEAGDPLPQLEVDPQRMAQVLANLLSNALRHTPAGGSIVLAARRSPTAPATLQLEVRDSGAGIAAEDLPHIFDRFWRADRSRSRGGVGLGLAIARQIIEAHGGSIAASSAPGQGTSMTIALPAAA